MTVVHLNRYHHFTELMRDPRIEGELRRFRSRHDGTLQTTLRLQPAGHPPDKLFFFFHGMDGDAGDGVIVRELVHRQSAAVVAMGGRGPCWVSSAFLADAQQVIGDHLPPFDRFHLIGVSMGGAQVLSLAALLTEELRRSLSGVVALIPGANLPAIAASSSNERVRQTLLASVHGDLSVLEQRSPARLLDQYPPRLPFVIFHNRHDTLLLSPEVARFIERLRKKGHPVTAFTAPGDHDFTYEEFDYDQAIRRLGSDSSEDQPPILRSEG